MTQFREFFAALSVEFQGRDVKTRPQGGRQLRYITARTVMNRLDEVAGPENWWDDYHPMEHSVLCRLTLRLPDGSTVTKCDAGGYAGMTDQGDDDKSGFSDAFKRAAVKFGIGRHLYQDGTAKLEPPAPPPPPYRQWLEEFCRDKNQAWIDHLKGVGSAPGELVSIFQLNRHLLKFLGVATMAKDEAANLKGGEREWETAMPAMTTEATTYCRKLWKDASAKLRAKREPGSDDNMPGPDEDAALDRLAGKAVAGA